MTRTRLLSCLILCTTLAAGAACAAAPDAGPDSAAARAALTQRQRDSAIGASRLPGAQGVTGALRAADSASARRAALEAAGREP